MPLPLPASARRRRTRRATIAALLPAVIAVLVACAPSAAGPGADSEQASTDARTVAHELGTTEITGVPTRVVALEYSFVQALDSLGVEPVGIADDDDPARIEQLLGRIPDYASVGTRLEPNLELVASLQPDLVIADLTRHGGIVDQLSAIAPTIVLTSWEGSYRTIKDSEVTIAEALGDKEAGERAVAEHEQRMADLAEQIPEGDDRRYLLAVANPADMSLHTSAAFTGSVFEALGLTPALDGDEAVESGAGLERLVDVDPDVLLVATQESASVFDTWPENAAWASLSAVRSGSVHEVDRNEFSRFRGLQTAERIAQEIVRNSTGER